MHRFTGSTWQVLIGGGQQDVGGERLLILLSVSLQSGVYMHSRGARIYLSFLCTVLLSYYETMKIVVEYIFSESLVIIEILVLLLIVFVFLFRS